MKIFSWFGLFNREVYVVEEKRGRMDIDERLLGFGGVVWLCRSKIQ